jgi:hypothetical protein
MKKISILFLFIFLGTKIFAQIGINATGAVSSPDAMLDVSSTTKGFLPPRMTTDQRIAITSPSAGLLVFDSTENQLFIFSNGAWSSIASPTYPRLTTEAIDALPNPKVGDIAYDLTFKVLKHFNGNRWVNVNQNQDAPKPDMMALGVGGTGFDQSNSIFVDNTGNIYVTGIFYDSVIFGNITLSSSGINDIFIAKYNSLGVIQWAKKAGGVNPDYGQGITVDVNGNVYVTGYFSGLCTFETTNLNAAGLYDIFLAKYDQTGSLQWVKRAGGSGDDIPNAIVVDGVGNTYITGSFRNTATFDATSINSAGGNDIFLAKYNSSGALVFVQQAGGIGEDIANSVYIDRYGSIMTAGSFSNSASFSGYILNSSGFSDIFIARYGTTGNIFWAIKAGGIGNDVAKAVTSNMNDDIFITGSFNQTASFGSNTITAVGNIDIFIAKIDISANFTWVRKAGGTNASDIGNAVVCNSVGDVYVTGIFEDESIFSTTPVISSGLMDIFVAKYSRGGVLQWVKKAGGQNLDFSSSIAVSSANNIYVTGFFSSSSTFGNSNLTSSGASDFFISRLKE